MAQTNAFDALPLDALEEASGELHRRIAAALRRMGEAGAERTDGDGRSPRWRAAALATEMELVAATLGSVAAGATAPGGRQDRDPSVVLALLYAAPSIPGLLARLDQDRRMLASLARSLEERLGETHESAWGRGTVRALLSEIAIAEPARCALALERRLAELEAEAAAEAEADAGSRGT